MNRARRKRIESVKAQLEMLANEIDTIRDQEQDYFDNIPENLQSSERASIAESAIDALDNASETIADVISSLEDAAG